ncbi:hypothetical protein SDC9_170222 [bioreactor metagenome]|uniref:Uncharacterized protein n=1 Tax=bioreactor metagenome TaxID=1076179 RepID=A0A645G7H5_9ZZZZ
MNPGRIPLREGDPDIGFTDFVGRWHPGHAPGADMRQHPDAGPGQNPDQAVKGEYDGILQQVAELFQNFFHPDSNAFRTIAAAAAADG